MGWPVRAECLSLCLEIKIKKQQKLWRNMKMRLPSSRLPRTTSNKVIAAILKYIWQIKGLLERGEATGTDRSLPISCWLEAEHTCSQSHTPTPRKKHFNPERMWVLSESLWCVDSTGRSCDGRLLPWLLAAERWSWKGACKTATWTKQRQETIKFKETAARWQANSQRCVTVVLDRCARLMWAAEVNWRPQNNKVSVSERGERKHGVRIKLRTEHVREYSSCLNLC